jgi:hypothetical protein
MAYLPSSGDSALKNIINEKYKPLTILDLNVGGHGDAIEHRHRSNPLLAR